MQGSLLDYIEKHGTVGLAGLTPAMRAAMNRAADEFPQGRAILADKISAIAEKEVVALTSGGGKKISKDILDKWLQPSASGHGPIFEAIVCFCLATGSMTPLKPLLDILKLTVISEEEKKFLEYGKSCWRIKEERKRKKELEAGL